MVEQQNADLKQQIESLMVKVRSDARRAQRARAGGKSGVANHESPAAVDVLSAKVVCGAWVTPEFVTITSQRDTLERLAAASGDLDNSLSVGTADSEAVRTVRLFLSLSFSLSIRPSPSGLTSV